MFLPDRINLPCGSIAKRRPHEPWFYSIVQAPQADFSHIIDIPGVGFDGYTKRWTVPEEVVALYLLKGETQ